ncbi:hypothetical protein EZS27_041551 [termite gut metagenome]|uniref:Uncharacterized protein n=1 Tax=termite gut metagenome TaxID=433724 RepID=A0A5J4PBC3_9ZZZZ
MIYTYISRTSFINLTENVYLLLGRFTDNHLKFCPNLYIVALNNMNALTEIIRIAVEIFVKVRTKRIAADSPTPAGETPKLAALYAVFCFETGALL